MRIELTAIFAGAVLFVLGGSANAENDEEIYFDTIYSLPFVHSIAFDSARSELFVAVDGHILQWQLEPLRLKNAQATQILINEMAVGPDGRIYSVGLGLQDTTYSSIRSMATIFSRSGSEEDGFVVDEQSWNRGIPEYSSLAFDSEARPVWASASSFTASPIPSFKDVESEGFTRYPQIRFSCGGVSQLSIFDLDGDDHYLVSSASAGTLEFGKLVWSEASVVTSNCFYLDAEAEKDPRARGLESLRHEIIDISDTAFSAEEATKGVLILDPNAGRLHLLRIERFGDRFFLARSGMLIMDLKPLMPSSERSATLTDITSDMKGREIQISSPSARTVLRISFDGERMRSRGRLAMSAAIQGIRISDDGKFSAVLIGDEPFGGDWRIVLTKNPTSLPDWSQVPPSFPSIRGLQEALNNNGLSAGIPDGILGPQTSSAVREYWRRGIDSSVDLSDDSLTSAIVTSFPRLLIEQQ